MMTRRFATLLVLCLGALVQSAAQETESLAPFVPTPDVVVDKMLELGGLKAGEKMFDLGSGDGRIVIAAAQKYGADATGVEFDAGRYKLSTEKIQKLHLEKTARIIHGDILKQDYRSADLITVYLLPVSNDRIRPMLEEQLKKGVRIVSHDFLFSDWTPVKSVDVTGGGDFSRTHTLYLYIR